MNQITKKLLGALVVFSAASTFAMGGSESTTGRTFFIPRSTNWNLPREMVGVTQFIAPCDSDCLNGFPAITPEYARNFNRDELGEYFFFNGTNRMTFGAAAANADADPTNDVWSRQIFLNDNFEGSATLLPRVENFVVDVRFRLNLDEWICGLYFDMHAPINWARFDLNLQNDVVNTGTFIETFALGNSQEAKSPNNSIIEALNGQQLNTATFPDLKQQLTNGRIDGSQTKTSLADITAALGYNFICNECYHVGVDIRAIFPTGTRPDGEFLFEPIIGNGKHFELGAGLNGHYEFWNNCCDSSFSLWVEGRVYHMFKARQRRLFDVNNEDGSQRVGSHWLLIKRFSSADTYSGEMLYGPNILTRQVKVRNDVHAELIALFDYQRCGFTLDFGYFFWARTKDKLTNIDPITPNTYAFAGRTLGSGSTTANRTGSTIQINGVGGEADGTSAANNVFLRTEDLSIESATHPTAMSHTLFVHAGYAWDGCDYTPFLGVGGAVEFSGRRNNALDEWQVWVKGGFGFM